MAKKKKSRKPAARKRAKALTAVDIVAMWEKSMTDGLDGKKLHSNIGMVFRQPLIDFVQGRLNNGDVFTDDDEKCTKQVAKDLGKICKILTTKKDTVSMDTFEPAYRLVQHFHDVCMSAGGGVWCEGGA